MLMKCAEFDTECHKRISKNYPLGFIEVFNFLDSDKKGYIQADNVKILQYISIG